MAAYGIDPARYLPPHTSQLATKLSADGVDDCLVCSALALVNGASLGEATRTPKGLEPSTAALVRTAVRMRRKLDDPDTATREQQRGPLPASAAGRMVALLWPSYPTLRTDDIDFKTLVALLQDEHVAVLAGNPSHIEGPSPLKRVGDVGHAIALLRARQRKDGLELLVDDPYRPGGKHLRGEWIAARQVRQFAFRDSDSTLTAVWVERYGAWTAENLARRRLGTRIGRIEAEAASAAKQAARTEGRLRARIAQLEAGSPVGRLRRSRHRLGGASRGDTDVQPGATRRPFRPPTRRDRSDGRQGLTWRRRPSAMPSTPCPPVTSSDSSSRPSDDWHAASPAAPTAPSPRPSPRRRVGAAAPAPRSASAPAAGSGPRCLRREPLMGRPASPDYWRRWRAAHPAYRERERERGRTRRRAGYRSPTSPRVRVEPEAVQSAPHPLLTWAQELAASIVREDGRTRLSDELYADVVGEILLARLERQDPVARATAWLRAERSWRHRLAPLLEAA
jgi:hypothetical protein